MVSHRVVSMLDAIGKGGYAEFALASADVVTLVPDWLDLAVASAVPTAGLTGLQLIEDHVQPRPGESVLITGATGAVRRFALHAARAADVRVVAAVRADQIDLARQLGANATHVLGAPALEAPAFDHVADIVAGPSVAALCANLPSTARIRTVATDPIESIGCASQPEFIAVRPDRPQLARLVASVADGEIDVSIAFQLPLSHAAEAHRLVELGGLRGKVVLRP